MPFVAAMAPAALSAMFASSSSAKMLASVQVPCVAGAPAAMVDVSLEAVLDAADVSAPRFSFLPHATTASAAMANAASLDLEPLINIAI